MLERLGFIRHGVSLVPYKLLSNLLPGAGRGDRDSTNHLLRFSLGGPHLVMVSTVGKSCRDVRAEGGDTEERNETGLMDGTYK